MYFIETHRAHEGATRKTLNLGLIFTLFRVYFQQPTFFQIEVQTLFQCTTLEKRAGFFIQTRSSKSIDKRPIIFKQLDNYGKLRRRNFNVRCVYKNARQRSRRNCLKILLIHSILFYASHFIISLKSYSFTDFDRLIFDPIDRSV